MREMVMRERNERVAAVELFARLLGAGLGLQPAIVSSFINVYAEEATQEAYLPSMITRRRNEAKERVKSKAKEMSLLERVAAMTVTDEEIAQTNKKKGRKRRS